MKTAQNRKQTQQKKTEAVIKMCGLKEVKCQGDILCCGKIKTADMFSPSALKSICKECTKNIMQKNRQKKIHKNEDYYIYEKIRTSCLRPGIFSSVLKCPEQFFYDWIKSQSKDPFNEHFDHVLPIYYFKRFSNASQYNYLRDSWINIMPLDAKENLSKHTQVDFSLFEKQLEKARDFIDNYQFSSNQEKTDILMNYEYICTLFKWLEQ